jgi:tRNA1Val (adenine37-N6)-methyltransferase
MKVGMDALLLGAWADVSETSTILDIGAGSGILALMMASRTRAVVDAVETDEVSVKEARQNFHRSAFHRRLNIIGQSLDNYVLQSNKKYDLVITNPPFFVNNLPSAKTQKVRARHTHTLSHEQLVSGSLELMHGNSRLCLVLPYAASKGILQIAESQQLYLQKQMFIFPVRGYPPNRVNLQLGLKKWDEVHIEKFAVREENGKFSEQYFSLLGDFLIGKANQ